MIVGGNDTTRNSMTGGVIFNENPGELEKLRNDTSLVPSMVSEVIRFQKVTAHATNRYTRL